MIRWTLVLPTILLFLFLVIATPNATAIATTMPLTYYDILELRPPNNNVTLTDIKKAYRRLAMIHHPDRNRGKEDEATLIFQKVSEAYEVLSDETKRKEYDEALRRGTVNTQEWHRQPHREPMDQFNDLFQNDPFFQEAFRGMDDRFAREFQTTKKKYVEQTVKPKKSWGEWIIDQLGINVQISTSTVVNGQQSSSTYQRSGSAYTKKNTRTVYENGQQVTIQSLEKDGNRIEERYIEQRLIGRLINGIPEDDRRLDL